MARTVNRRGFIKGSLAASASLTLASSHEEQALLAKPTDAALRSNSLRSTSQKTDEQAPARQQRAHLNMPMGKIRHVEISRLICGGNLIIGSSHDRDLIYVASLMRHYFTDRKIIETWQLCEECGINHYQENIVGENKQETSLESVTRTEDRGQRTEDRGQNF